MTESQLVLIDRYTFDSKVKKCDPLVRELLQNFTNNLRAITQRKLNETCSAEPEPETVAPSPKLP